MGEHDDSVGVDGGRDAGGAGMSSAAQADAAMVAAGLAYFASRRARVADFARRHFSWRGTLRLHRAAFGWDIARAPVNVLLAPVHVLTRLLGLLAGRLGLPACARWLGNLRVLLPTTVSRRVEALIVMDLLELPWQQGEQRSERDALAEAVLAAAPVRALLRDRQAAALGDGVARSLGEYSGTRSAVGEMTTALGALGTGALLFQSVTPGMLSFTPAIAAVLAQSAAIAAFPLGAGAGALWYGLFPAEASPWLSALTLLGLILGGSLITAFAGILADPVQLRLGIHQRRLLRLIDTLEAEFIGSDPRAFSAREHYLARLLDVVDAGMGAARLLRG